MHRDTPYKAGLRAVETLAPQDNKKPKTATKAAYIAYSVIEQRGNDRPAVWCRIGAAFHHKDGGGLDLVLNALPLNGRLALRKPKTEADQQAIKSAALELAEDEGEAAILAFDPHHH